MHALAPRAVTAICHALQEQIEHGLLAPGCKLPAERKLSEVFDTTRITLRVPGQDAHIEAEVTAEHASLAGLARGDQLYFRPRNQRAPS